MEVPWAIVYLGSSALNNGMAALLRIVYLGSSVVDDGLARAV